MNVYLVAVVRFLDSLFLLIPFSGAFTLVCMTLLQLWRLAAEQATARVLWCRGFAGGCWDGLWA